MAGDYATRVNEEQDTIFPWSDFELPPTHNSSSSLPTCHISGYSASSSGPNMAQPYPSTFPEPMPEPMPDWSHSRSSSSYLGPVPGDRLARHDRRRRRSRHPSPYAPTRRITSHPIPIPASRHSDAPPQIVDSQIPLQRWRESPPSDEPASFEAIRQALQSFRPSPSYSLQSRAISDDSGTSQHSPRFFRTESPSIASSHSTASNASSGVSRPRLTHPPTRAWNRRAAGPKNRRFQCTFCCDSFRSKHDWVRHEKSLHLNTEEWLCAPYGGVVLSATTSRLHCAFCNMLDPSQAHLESHHSNTCRTQSGEPARFRRRDHLAQHLRLVHKLDNLPLIDDWKATTGNITSRCGFCHARMETWDERAAHLANHFRQGRTMKDWTGEHEFEPRIAAVVTNALPPYLIHSESQCVVPFSSTDEGGTKDHYDQICRQVGLDEPDQTWCDQGSTDSLLPAALPETAPEPSLLPNPPVFVDALCFHLSRYAQRQMQLGILPTDVMLQNESRRIIYGCDDEWNQTVADNPQWLAKIRQQFSTMDT